MKIKKKTSTKIRKQKIEEPILKLEEESLDVEEEPLILKEVHREKFEKKINPVKSETKISPAARKMANEANVNFVYANGSEFIEMYVGVGASRVRKLFDKAKENKPFGFIGSLGWKPLGFNSEA